jgi:membrane protein required for colicin V production
MGLTALDILVILLIGAGLVVGWLRGFVAELLSLFAWFLAIVAVRYLHEPVRDLLTGFGLVFLGGKLASRRLGSRVRSSVVGPVDRLLGAGFGALKGLIGATLLFLIVNLVYDTIWGRAALRPEWISQSRTYPLLESSSAMMVDLIEARRGPAPETNQAETDVQ